MRPLPVEGEVRLPMLAARPWRWCLAVWLASLLAAAPLLQPTLPGSTAAAGSSLAATALVVDQLAHTLELTIGLRPAAAGAAGLLGRSTPPEPERSLPPALAAIAWPPLALLLAAAIGGASPQVAGSAVQPGALGTARRPTGPPA
jgi:hypothetical protein